MKQNSALQGIYLSSNNIGSDFESQIAEYLKENIFKKEMFYREFFICAFTLNRKALIRLGFDKMILRFVYYPMIDFSSGDKQQ
jgi:hypothetical protein